MQLISVALVIDSLDRGGAERLLVSIANNLDTQKYHVIVITTNHKGKFVDDLNPEVDFFCLDQEHSPRITKLFRFIKFIKKNRIQIIHSHAHSTAYFVELSRRFFHLSFHHIMHDHYGLVFQKKMMQQLDHLLLRNLDYYFAVSEQLYQYAITEIGIPKNKCQYLPNGITVPKTINQDRYSTFTIVQVGTISSNKNQLMAIRIAARLQEVIPEYQWLIIGKFGADKQYINLIKEEIRSSNLQKKVYLLGEKSDISYYLQQAHVGVLTSQYEALPMALLEYMAWGLPVVVTDAGDCFKIVEKSGGGKAVSINDDQAFFQTLIDLYKKPDLGKAWGLKNHSNIVSNYGIKKMISRIEKVYEELIFLDPIYSHQRE